MGPSSVNQLITLIEEGNSYKYLFFWGHKQRGAGIDDSCLSQWFPSTFIEEDITFPTAEHYMMYHKARLFGDDQAANKARLAKSPGEAKAAGRSVIGFDETRWTGARVNIVTNANILKFSQNSDIGAFLLGTGRRVLVEASPVDRIWGIGMSKEEAIKTPPTHWKGLNLLGFSLMAARAQILSQD